MRDILVPFIRGDAQFLEAKEAPYYRDIDDHIRRVMSQLDAAQDVVNGTLELHLGLAAQRQAEVTRQLTIIATIFLPLSFITGFFGQNFAHLVNIISSEQSFLIFGVGSQLLTLGVLLAFFKRKRWI